MLMCWWTKTNLPWVEINIRKDGIRSVVHSKISLQSCREGSSAVYYVSWSRTSDSLWGVWGVGVNFSLVVMGSQGERANYNEDGGTWIPTSHSSDGDCKPGGAGWGRWSQAAVGLKSCFAPCYLVTISKLGTDQGRVPSRLPASTVSGLPHTITLRSPVWCFSYFGWFQCSMGRSAGEKTVALTSGEKMVA